MYSTHRISNRALCKLIFHIAQSVAQSNIRSGAKVSKTAMALTSWQSGVRLSAPITAQHMQHVRHPMVKKACKHKHIGALHINIHTNSMK